MTIKERKVAEKRSSAPPEDVLPVTSAEAIPMVEATPLGEPLSSSIAMPVTEAITPPNNVRVRVMSPMALPEGATFKAVVDGIEFMAKVPRGGVREGEIFETTLSPNNPGDGTRNAQWLRLFRGGSGWGPIHGHGSTRWRPCGRNL